MGNVGGQAVIEGVMMRSDKKMAIAVRNPKGKIVVKVKKLDLLSARMKKWIFIRGVINLVEMLIHGVKSLNYSVEVATGEKPKKKNTTDWFTLFIVIFFSAIVGLAFFKLLPLWIAKVINPESNLLFNLIDGSVKLLLFVAYVYVISLWKDMRRVFSYHGAEHKAVHCYESKKKLTVQNAKKFSTVHCRCGTNFIAIVIMISIVVYVFIPKTVPFMYKFLYRILLLPIIASISYEVLKLGAKYENNFLMRLFDQPGLWVQRITTKEPDDKQLEVALVALKKVI